MIDDGHDSFHLYSFHPFGVLFLVGALLRVNRFFFPKAIPRPELYLQGQNVLWSGASTGIGRTLALRYADRGAKVCVWRARVHN